jgi:hypothetical protein
MDGILALFVIKATIWLELMPFVFWFYGYE